MGWWVPGCSGGGGGPPVAAMSGMMLYQWVGSSRSGEQELGDGVVSHDYLLRSICRPKVVSAKRLRDVVIGLLP